MKSTTVTKLDHTDSANQGMAVTGDSFISFIQSLNDYSGECKAGKAKVRIRSTGLSVTAFLLENITKQVLWHVEQMYTVEEALKLEDIAVQADEVTLMSELKDGTKAELKEAKEYIKDELRSKFNDLNAKKAEHLEKASN